MVIQTPKLQHFIPIPVFHQLPPTPMVVPTNPSPPPAAASASTRVSRGWHDLTPDLLLAILSRVPTLDLLAGVHAVCSSWRSAARDPAFWRSVDLSDWDAVAARFGGGEVSFVQMVARVAAFSRSGRCVERLCLPPSADGQDLIFVAERLPNLTYLSVPNPDIGEDEFSIALPKFRSLTGLAVDQYFGNSVHLLSLLENHCPNLTEFKLLDHDDRLEHHNALIICHYLPQLRKLEIPIRLSRHAILAFLEGLHELEYLDISGYQDSVINDEILLKASRLKVFIWHSGHELGEFVVCSNCGETESVGMPCQCVLEEKIMEWLAKP